MVSKYLVSFGQTIEAKWHADLDPYISDTVMNAPADDNAAANIAPSSPSFTKALEQMRATVNSALNATNHLLIQPKYQKSPGLQAFKNQLPQLQSVLSGIKNPDSESLGRVEQIIGSLNFYSDPSNQGTGYDAMTHAKDQGVAGPGHFMNNLTSLNKYLNTTLEF